MASIWKQWFLERVQAHLRDRGQLSLPPEGGGRRRGRQEIPMKFNPDKTAFGRHETFALRFGWLLESVRE